MFSDSVLDERQAFKYILNLQEMGYEPVLVLAWIWGHEWTVEEGVKERCFRGCA